MRPLHYVCPTVDIIVWKSCCFIHGSSQTWSLPLSRLQIALNLSCDFATYIKKLKKFLWFLVDDLKFLIRARCFDLFGLKVIVQGSVFLRSARSFTNMLPNLLEQDGYFEEVEKKGWFFYPSVCLSLFFGLWIKEKKKKK